MEASKSGAWRRREVVLPDSGRLAYWELALGDQPISLIRDVKGQEYALFEFRAAGTWDRFVLVAPRRRGRLTFFRESPSGAFRYAGGATAVEFAPGLAPTEVAMRIQTVYEAIEPRS